VWRESQRNDVQCLASIANLVPHGLVNELLDILRLERRIKGKGIGDNPAIADGAVGLWLRDVAKLPPLGAAHDEDQSSSTVQLAHVLVLQRNFIYMFDNSSLKETHLRDPDTAPMFELLPLG
jgi:hypothetical protein